jgi:hypothetical protein
VGVGIIGEKFEEVQDILSQAYPAVKAVYETKLKKLPASLDSLEN